jgi:MFS family permease
MLSRARLLIATFWVGMLWAVGFVVAPTLFSTLSDRALAGTIAGSLFHIVAWLSLLCAAALVALLFQATRSENLRPSKTVLYLIAGMVVCTLVGYFGLQPTMASLREVLHATADASQLVDAKKQFGILHAASTGIYIVQSLLGAALILKIR